MKIIFTPQKNSKEGAFQGEFCADLNSYLEANANSNRRPRKNTIRPSELGYCIRKTVMSILNICPPEIISAQQARVFSNGTYVHKRYLEEYLPNLKNFLPCNVIEDDGQPKPFIEVTIKNDLLWLRGAPDAILFHRVTGKPYVFELKSINAYTFRSLNEPTYAHVIQAACYMEMLDIKNTIFLYEEKDSHRLKEFVLPYTEALRRELLERIHKVQKYVLEYERTKALPQKCDSPRCVACIS